MIDFFESIGEVIVNVFNFIVEGVKAFFSFRQMVLDFFVLAANVIMILPGPVQALIYAGLTLLVTFIIIELLRDFL